MRIKGKLAVLAGGRDARAVGVVDIRAFNLSIDELCDEATVVAEDQQLGVVALVDAVVRAGVRPAAAAGLEQSGLDPTKTAKGAKAAAPKDSRLDTSEFRI